MVKCICPISDNTTGNPYARILTLTLKKCWFDMILSGEKTDEYREIKWYWIKRLVTETHLQDFRTAKHINEVKDNNQNEFFKQIDYIRFRNGYSKTAPEMIIEFKGITIDYGVPKWGAEIGELYFVISLGKILKTTNLK